MANTVNNRRERKKRHQNASWKLRLMEKGGDWIAIDICNAIDATCNWYARLSEECDVSYTQSVIDIAAEGREKNRLIDINTQKYIIIADLKKKALEIEWNQHLLLWKAESAS